jgi:hypothetical protein
MNLEKVLKAGKMSMKFYTAISSQQIVSFTLPQNENIRYAKSDKVLAGNNDKDHLQMPVFKVSILIQVCKTSGFG